MDPNTLSQFWADNGTAIITYAVVILLVLICAFILLLRLRRAVRRWLARRRSDLDRAEIQKRWARVMSLLNAPDADTDRLAIIEADSLLDFVLKSMQMPGGTMAQRLGYAANKYYELKRVWWAHGLRNRIVHEEDFKMSRQQAKSAINEFQRALQVVGAL